MQGVVRLLTVCVGIVKGGGWGRGNAVCVLGVVCLCVRVCVCLEGDVEE